MSKDNGQYYKFIDEATVNLAQHEYDTFIEESVQRFSEAGIKSVIIRRQLTQCCEYCAKLAGIYQYAAGEYPDDIFKRHENCRCLVTVKTEKGGYVNAWNKKEYATQREARIEREKEIENQSLLKSDYLKEKNKAKDSGKAYFEATDYWKNKEKEFPVRVIEKKKTIEYEGIKYDVDGKDVLYDEDKDAKRVLEWFKKRYGGTIQRFPRIIRPKFIKTPDLFINGEKADVKRIDKEEGSKDAIYNAVHRKERQAHFFIIDTSKSLYDKEEWKTQARKLFLRDGTKKWIDRVILLADDEVYYVVERP